jgi:hypothetical protein
MIGRGGTLQPFLYCGANTIGFLCYLRLYLQCFCYWGFRYDPESSLPGKLVVLLGDNRFYLIDNILIFSKTY